MARGEAGSASDIDLLVLLAAPLDGFAELRQRLDLLYPIQLESEQLISAKPGLASDYELGGPSLYRNARREGVSVYGAVRRVRYHLLWGLQTPICGLQGSDQTKTIMMGRLPVRGMLPTRAY